MSVGKRPLRSSVKALSESSKPLVMGSTDLRKRSKETAENWADVEFISPSGNLSTPAKKKARRVYHALLPEPNFLQIVSSENIDQASFPLNRPAESHGTNISGINPRSSCLVAFSRKDGESSQSERAIARPKTTTLNMLEQACDRLIQVDSRFKPLIEKHPCPLFSPKGLAEEIDPFKALCNGIISQQISGAAAKSIKEKFVKIFGPEGAGINLLLPNSFPRPKEVAEAKISDLRQAGLSQRKAEYIQGLAEKFVSGELDTTVLINSSDEELMKRLTAVRGLGKWSVEMFSCFCLKRMDVLSTGDLGVQYEIPLSERDDTEAD